MNKNYYYKNYPDIAQAMKIYNITRPGSKFTLLDFNILCLAKSFHDSGNNCYISNDQLANQLLSCEKTVRTSINRLCKAGFLKKDAIARGRCLVYQKEKVIQFVDEMNLER